MPAFDRFRRHKIRSCSVGFSPHWRWRQGRLSSGGGVAALEQSNESLQDRFSRPLMSQASDHAVQVQVSFVQTGASGGVFAGAASGIGEGAGAGAGVGVGTGGGGVHDCSSFDFGVSALGQSKVSVQVLAWVPAVEQALHSVQLQVSWLHEGTEPPPPPPTANAKSGAAAIARIPMPIVSGK